MFIWPISTFLAIVNNIVINISAHFILLLNNTLWLYHSLPIHLLKGI